MILRAVITRNVKLFFKDKGMFFTSLLTPVILLVLYATFLANVYHDSFAKAVPEGFELSENILKAAVGGQLLSSILAVCCVTTAFCSNLLMVQDKVSGARNDLTVSPVKNSVLSLGYYISTVISTLLVSFTAFAVCLIYVHSQGWYMTAEDIGCIALDIVLLVLFGTALSSIINVFLSTQGQMSAVGTIISAGYGFICGAYMPISQFGSGLQKVVYCLPGTYGTSLLRNHAMNGVFREMDAQGLPAEFIDGIKVSVDCCPKFFDSDVSTSAMYIYLAATVVVLIAAYIILNAVKEKRNAE